MLIPSVTTSCSRKSGNSWTYAAGTPHQHGFDPTCAPLLHNPLQEAAKARGARQGESVKPRNDAQGNYTLLTATYGLPGSHKPGRTLWCCLYASARHPCCLVCLRHSLWPRWGVLQESSGLTEVWGMAGSDKPSESVLLRDSGVGLPCGDPGQQ